MARFLISAPFCDMVLTGGKRLLEGGVYSDLRFDDAALIRGRSLFEARRLLEEIR